LPIHTAGRGVIGTEMPVHTADALSAVCSSQLYGIPIARNIIENLKTRVHVKFISLKHVVNTFLPASGAQSNLGTQ